MTIHNMMTCSNLGVGFLGDCSMAWFSLAIILFLALVARRQCEDGILAGTGFNFIGALLFGLGANLSIITFFGSLRWAFVGGIIGIVIGGYVIGMFLDTTGGGEE
jgi:hypothetical protein